MEKSTKRLGALAITALGVGLILNSKREGVTVTRAPARIEQSNTTDAGIIEKPRLTFAMRVDAAVGLDGPDPEESEPPELTAARDIVEEYEEYRQQFPFAGKRAMKEFLEKHGIEKMMPFLGKLMKEGSIAAFDIAWKIVQMKLDEEGAPMSEGPRGPAYDARLIYKKLKEDFDVEPYHVAALESGRYLGASFASEGKFSDDEAFMKIHIDNRALQFAGLLDKFNAAGEHSDEMLTLFLKTMSWSPRELLDNLLEVDAYYKTQPKNMPLGASLPGDEVVFPTRQKVRELAEIVSEKYEIPIAPQ